MTKTAIAMGIFDGMHLGHRAVIEKAVSYQEQGYTPGVFTFLEDSISTKNRIGFLANQGHKDKLFKRVGANFVSVYDLEKIKDLSPREFFTKIILGELKAGVVVCGENFHFGKNGEGDTKELQKLCEEFSVICDIVPFVTYKGETISSTIIRELIAKGEIRKANKLLGYDFNLKCVIGEGKKIGRTLDFPTINQKFDEGSVIPALGVYATYVEIEGRKYKGISNIGIKPTVSDENIVGCETYIFDFNENVYGKKAIVYFTQFIRSEKKFNSLEELKQQISTDIKARINIK